MTLAPEHEQPRRPEGEGFSDAVTFAFGDERADLYGVARLGLRGGAASGLAILFHGGKPVSVAAEGGIQAPEQPSWDEVSAAGIDTGVVEALRRWTVSFASDDATFDLEAEALGAVAELDVGSAAARLGGMAGYEQPVRVRGAATVAGRRLEVDALGQRGHSWGAPTILERSATSGEPAAVRVGDPRLSTTYDAGGHTRSAGLELWVDDDYPRRAAGEVVCGTSLNLGRLRLDCAFFRWRMEGRTGVGRYDVLRKV